VIFAGFLIVNGVFSRKVGYPLYYKVEENITSVPWIPITQRIWN